MPFLGAASGTFFAGRNFLPAQEEVLTGGSMSFVGNATSYLSVANSADFRFGAGDFTIEWWQYQTDSTLYPRIFYMGVFPDQSIGVTIESGTFYFWGSSAISFGTLSSYKNVWTHFAVTRSGTSLRAFRDGFQIGTTQTNNTNFNDTTNSFVIANQGNFLDAAAFGGRITNFHVVKGTAKYTSNFTPTGPLSPISGTVLLLKAVSNETVTADSSASSKGVTNSNVTWSSSTPF